MRIKHSLPRNDGGSSPTVREGVIKFQKTPSLTVGLLPRNATGFIQAADDSKSTMVEQSDSLQVSLKTRLKSLLQTPHNSLRVHLAKRLTFRVSCFVNQTQNVSCVSNC